MHRDTYRKMRSCCQLIILLLLVLAPVAQAQTESVLLTFGGPAKGATPEAPLLRDSAGNFYGTASTGGPSDWGVVFKIDPAGHETGLHSFSGGDDGGDPVYGLTRDSAGNLYGTTWLGGPDNAGVIFKVTPAGQESVLYSFTSMGDGDAPSSGVIMEFGAIYEVSAAGGFTTLYSFPDYVGDAALPNSLAIDSAGNLYGTTLEWSPTGPSGGTAIPPGIVFKLPSHGNEEILYHFTGGADGSHGFGLTVDHAGNMYGATPDGGSGYGTLFELSPAGQITEIYAFPGGSGGGPPNGFFRDSAGNFYGTAEGGATGDGLVFELSAAGQYQVLYNFTGGAGGEFPETGVIQDAAGNLYGTAASVLFEIKP